MIQTEELCASFHSASVINGNDKKTLESTIDVVENTDPNGTGNNNDNAWSTDLWGGD